MSQSQQLMPFQGTVEVSGDYFQRNLMLIEVVFGGTSLVGASTMIHLTNYLTVADVGGTKAFIANRTMHYE